MNPHWPIGKDTVHRPISRAELLNFLGMPLERQQGQLQAARLLPWMELPSSFCSRRGSHGQPCRSRGWPSRGFGVHVSKEDLFLSSWFSLPIACQPPCGCPRQQSVLKVASAINGAETSQTSRGGA